MKRFIKLLIVGVMIVLTGCSSITSKDSNKVTYTKEEAKVWNVTLVESIKENVLMHEWYGSENPIIYLRKTRKMSEKEFRFLDDMGKKPVEEITDEDLERFTSLVAKYNKKLERKFFLERENIKDGRGFVRQMARDAKSGIDTPAKWISQNVAEKGEWDLIEKLAEKDDLTEKDLKALTKTLNKFMTRDNFFNYTYWVNVEISERVADTIRLSNITPRTALIRNNLNAKAFYVVYSDYLSQLDRWKD